MSGCAQARRSAQLRTTRMEDVLVLAGGKRSCWRYRDSHVLSHRRPAMTMLPVRRSSGRNLTVVNPFREFEDIYDRMGQLMNLAFGLAPVDVAEGPWLPLADVSETEDAYAVEVDLPGVNRDQIGIQLQDRELVITGEIPESEQKGRRHRRSRRTGRFEFRTYLPGDVNADGVNAQLSNGVLTVTIPKSQEAQPRQIEIKG